MILVFDLDDTLYEEMSFVRSGFRNVAEFLHASYGLDEDVFYIKLMDYLKEGRGTVFDKALTEYGIFSRSLVSKCLNVYRYHNPEINLYDDAVKCFERFKFIPKYIVTDGNKFVQANKIKALGLHQYIKWSYITHRYGIIYSKPSDYVFLKICKKESAVPQQILYIGDNPMKDFVGIKPKGYNTVRILRGNYKDVRVSESFDAKRNILSLDEITEEFLNKI